MVSMAFALWFALYASVDFMWNTKNNVWLKAVVGVIFVMTVWLVMQRDTYLPFLSKAAFPTTLVKDAFIGVNGNVKQLIRVDAPDGTKLAYWAAKTSNVVQSTPRIAYDDFVNSGVALVKNGQATLTFSCPSKYTVPWGHILDRHVHYRLMGDDGMMSRVHTVFVDCPTSSTSTTL